MNIQIIFTCYNRKEKTLRCMESLVQGNSTHTLSFIVADDGSSDGTADAIARTGYNVTILHGDGSMFWAGGMRLGIGYYLTFPGDADYVMLINDDVVFDAGILDALIARSVANDNAVVVGATRDKHGNFTYGGMRLTNKGKHGWYKPVLPSEDVVECDMFNCNCVLILASKIRMAGNFDTVYRHALADFDYGMRLKRLGYRLVSSAGYVGECSKNTTVGTWRDSSFPRMKRIRLKETVKGSPFKEWFHFIHKNFGIWKALRYSITPYLRILIGK